MDIKEKIKDLPRSPGVYIMKGSSAEALYVGKAGDLKKRVSSYFYPNKTHPERIRALAKSVADISYITTQTEAEALIYENGLIKQLSPKYNIALRDDKTYPMLKLTVGERYARLLIVRQKKNDGSLYFGPYADAKLLKKALVILRQLFPLRSCAKLGKKVCLNYHIKQCLGPCEGRIGEAAYNEIVSELKLFLRGARAELLKYLTDKMSAASRSEKFEEAANYKSRLEALSSIKDKAVAYTPQAELEELGAILELKAAPDNIEAFDVSNIMGTAAVGSMISFYKGKPNKSRYRKFRIKTVSKVDDYAMMREIVKRRYSRLLAEGSNLPDLILIDGGKGHLSAAQEELDRLGMKSIPIASIAKEFCHIYTKGKSDPISLPKESKALHLVERIRDEAHRFAITYHKRLLSKNIKDSALDEIPGIGRKRKSLLIKYFGSLQKIKSACLEDILKVKGIDEKTARNIIDYFKKR